MASDNPDIGRVLFHTTHADNIRSILSEGILSHNMIKERNLEYAPVHDAEIVSIRRDKTTDGKNSLWNYASLYFQPRNPMLYRVICENPPKDIAIIAVKKSILSLPGVYISDSNAATDDAKFYTNEKFGFVEPQIQKMAKRKWWSWHDSSKRKIMAECLVPDKVPPEYIEAVYVSGHDAKDRIGSFASPIPVIPEPGMFFQPVKMLEITDRLSLVKGDMFFSKMQTLTISVNCKGIMGKGLASRAKYQFPDVYVHYQEKCRNRTLRMGKPVLYYRESPYSEEIADGPSKSFTKEDRWFLLFATKQHWREDSDINGIEQGLRWLADN